MSLNKLALIRYKTIDYCLRNRARKWTLENLIEKVSEALYEYEGIRGGVSKRTIQLDLQTMRSDKLGYNAPIVTKPLHVSQTVLKDADGQLIIQIEVVLNFELEREILGFGEKIKVLAPRQLVKRVSERLNWAGLQYQISS